VRTVYTKHSSAKTRGLFCDGKPCFEVVVRNRFRGEQESYYCGNRHEYFDPAEVTAETCPRPEKPRLRRIRFNGGRNGYYAE